VLIVDDEEGVRDIAAMVMETHGAAVLRAASGEEALTILRDPARAISLALLDMTMPGMGGEETLRRLREIHPRLPVILMSGYSESQSMQRSSTLGVAGFLKKPFEIEALLAAVKPHLA
jgi:DNA-binding NtrC family response regulator